ncbi:acyl-CoA dehydrogenase family protein [Chachezhania sediminis]|uniref:acyl-CoA dehydrogenase family protein n=1 Tax=Chachezhania sediminis TaxID=2599291 RepID=UPI00131AC2AA|nr:acyl-CoA dehydrogenase family protein [Chachezhania sediminis]
MTRDNRAEDWARTGCAEGGLPPQGTLGTHEVANQPPMPAGRDLWASDRALRDAVTAALAAGSDDADRDPGQRLAALAAAGALYGSEETHVAAEDARRDRPRLKLFDRSGRRLDEVAFSPSYHRLMELGVRLGYAAKPWDGKKGGHVAHAALVYMQSQVEPGIACPLTMTYAAVPALAASPEVQGAWRPGLTARVYDPSIRPAARKAGLTMGMAMTEKQGGSDVRANTTVAEREGAHYRLTGHKWFCSAPMSDGFLTLAQAPEGLTCFLVPRWLEGERNAIRLQRLKDKLGNVANASSEIEYDRALAYRLGDEGAGVRTIIEMVHHTRLDTAMAPAGLMRAAVAEAHAWVSGRTAFQKKLIDQPLMRAVLADLALDAEGALAAGIYVARSFDDQSEKARAFARIGVALAKYLSNKRCIAVTAEAMEVLGGMGYVEETPMPMLYREAPLNGIWEGSGNVICLDILRTLARDKLAAEVLQTRLLAARGHLADYDAALDAHLARWPGLPEEAQARWFAESLAGLLTCMALIDTAPEAIAAGYARSRLRGERGSLPGAVAGLDTGAILSRLA